MFQPSAQREVARTVVGRISIRPVFHGRTWKSALPRIALVAALVLLGAATAGYAVTLSLSSTAPDLNHLVVGQTVSFQVELSGLEPSQELDGLAATVTYGPGLLSEPTISPGPIVPDPLYDPLDFLTAPGPGIADASFLTFGTASSDHIVSGGAFFLFDVTALAPGTGSLSFDFVDATEFNPADPPSPIQLFPDTGPPLSFTIEDVPEPSTLILALCAALAGAWLVRRLRHKDRKTA